MTRETVVRDPLMAADHFESFINYSWDEIERHRGPATESTVFPRIVSAMYSVGCPVGELRPVFKQWVAAAAQVREPVPRDLVFPLSFGLLLGVDDKDLELLQVVVDRDTRHHAFSSFLADSLGLSHAPVAGDGTLWRFFPKVREIEDPTGKAEYLGWWLKRWWYTVNKAETWWGSHARHGGAQYYSYWAWEVAGTVRAYGLDDTLCCASQYYPKDLARFLVQGSGGNVAISPFH